MMTLCSLKTLRSNYPLTRHHVPEEWNLHLYHYKNLKTHDMYMVGEEAATFFNRYAEEMN
jgi:hypothetical protein